MSATSYTGMRVSPEEKEVLKAKAQAAGFSTISDYLKAKALAEDTVNDLNEDSDLDEPLTQTPPIKDPQIGFNPGPFNAQPTTYQDPLLGGFMSGLGGLGNAAAISGDVQTALQINTLNNKLERLVEIRQELQQKLNKLELENDNLKNENKKLQAEVEEDNRAERKNKRLLETISSIAAVVPEEAKANAINGLMGLTGIGGGANALGAGLNQEDQDSLDLGKQIKEAFPQGKHYQAFLTILTQLASSEDILKKVFNMVRPKTQPSQTQTEETNA